MVEEATFEFMVSNLPNFIFSGVCVAILYRINTRLMDTLDRMCERVDKALKTED